MGGLLHFHPGLGLGPGMEKKGANTAGTLMRQPALEPPRGPLQPDAMRQLIKKETEELAPLFRKGGTSYPNDFRLRIVRITIAMHLLDRLAMIAAPHEPGARAISGLLGDSFFSKSAEDIRESYEALRACPAAIRLRLLPPVMAVSLYVKKLSADIDRMNGL